ncbi:3-hydroxyisobutyryl-CoA hydrolase [Corynebacterium lipophiloflavum]|uniref:3-hydroxyisobutyryl-CoA hydrolase n=1 Tax=Corynebacterium lipophiloflavum (strain ATCC 700352 / DSM 44291 / CCUG 37336 / JCM 10383 / DMMZ 1944) TaxID=525263 RepID=C0XQ28_CORLD|nr:3-hydroxyisobutyryl-CoA hydrolase [Corynebacterium lipophiloflavum]EEI17672.1 enoyl-CoA hydratase/isomerase family protein [Corynebacterium lipophiloflavum DSM 44291]
MNQPVKTSVLHHTGVITLDRPKALNSLNHEMVRLIAAALDEWRDDAAVEQVIIHSSGKHFCAGGDVRAARDGVVEGRAEEVDAYFAEEYAMNLDISTYPKPYTALASGVIMGGGLGVSAHGSHLVVTEDAFASMPEMSIGFITDVGMSHRLQNLPKHPSAALGTFLALTGYRLSADDMLATGLATHKVASLDGLVERIAAEGLGVLDEVALEAGESELAGFFDAVEGVFVGSWPEISQRLDSAPPELAQLVEKLTAQASPSALVASSELMVANSSLDLAQSLENERALGAVMSREPDFAEGVRAVLIDKTNDANFAAAPEPEHYRRVLRHVG